MGKKRNKYKSTLRGYDAYVQNYKKAEAELKKKGLTMADKMYNKLEYKTTYKAIKNDREKAIAKGERKTIGNINREMIKDQTYEFTQKQAKAMQKAIERQTGNKYRLQDIRAKKYEIDWNEIDLRKAELKEMGLNFLEIKQVIGKEYFGSK